MTLAAEPRAHEPDATPHVVGGRNNPDFAYKPQLDGLRAVAVLSVLVYHGRAEWMVGGYLGVDLFFVLSGYLITTLMLIESDRDGRVDLGQFWLRRAKRLLPAMFLVVGAVVVYGRLNADAVDLDSLRGDALATIGYIANWWYVATGSSYFEQFSAPSLLRHTWSLAIEEQFYVLWPLLVGGGLRFVGRRRQTWIAVLGGITAISAAWMVVLTDSGVDLSRVYYGTDARLQALSIGAVLAFVLHRRSASLPAGTVNAVSLAGVGVMAAMFVLVSDQSQWMYRGGFTLFGIVAAIVIGAVVRHPNCTVARLAAAGPLPAIGRVSYGVYLWHWPVYVVLGQHTTLSGLALIGADLVITAGCAAASYHFLEMPIRRGVLRRPQIRAATLAALVTLFALTVTASGHATTGVTAAIEGNSDIDLTTGRGGPVPGNATRDPGEVAVLLVGDSVAAGLGNNFDEQSGGGGLFLYNAGRVGCGVVSGEPQSVSADMQGEQFGCETMWPVWTDVVAEQQPDVVVMLPGGHEVFDHVVDGQVLAVGTPEYRTHARADLEQALQILTSTGARLVLLTTPCFDQTRGGGLSAFADPLVERTAAEAWRVDWLNGLWAEFAAAHPDTVQLLDLHGVTCPGGAYSATLDGVALHVDGVHFTPEAAKSVWAWVGPQLVAG